VVIKIDIMKKESIREEIYNEIFSIIITIIWFVILFLNWELALLLAIFWRLSEIKDKLKKHGQSYRVKPRTPYGDAHYKVINTAKIYV